MKRIRETTTRIINPGTGEIENQKQTAQYISAIFDENKGYLFWNKKGFAKNFSDIPFPKLITYAEIGRLTILSKKLYSNTNMIGYRGNGGVRAYDVKGLGEIINLKEYQAKSFIRKMVKHGIIKRATFTAEGKSEIQFYMNPLYFFGSNRLPLNLYLIFKDQLDPFLPMWVKNKFAEQQSI